MVSGLSVSITLGEIKWTNFIYALDGGRDRLTTQSPCLWTIFFKLDGESVRAGSRGRLAGAPTVVGTRGSHGNLGIERIESSRPVAIPSSIGQWSCVLRPIPVMHQSEPRDGVDGAVAIGVAVVLMQACSFSAGRSKKAQHILNRKIRTEISELIARRRLADVADQLPSYVSRAITAAESSWRSHRLDPGCADRIIDHAVFSWLQPAIAKGQSPDVNDIPFSHRHAPGWWEEWELNGVVSRCSGIQTVTK